MFFRLIILLVLSSSSYAETNNAIPGKQYPHTTGEFQVQLITQKKLSIYSKYNWSICNEPLLNKELNTHNLAKLKKIIEVWSGGAARHKTGFIKNIETVFSESTNKKLMAHLSSRLNPMGICVNNLKIYLYKK